MGVHTAHDRDRDIAIMYCSTTGWAFGPVFNEDGGHDADERVEAFQRWLQTTDKWSGYDFETLALLSGRCWRDRDPRQLTDKGLQAAYGDWLAQEADQWAREQAEEDARFTAEMGED